MDKLLLLLVALPFLSALLTMMLSNLMGRSVIRIGLAASITGAVLAGYLLWSKMAGQESVVLSLDTAWGSLWFDPLSLLMAFVISTISLLVRVYSVRYMTEETGYIRFFILLDLMVGTLLLMVSAGDLIMLLIAWHLVGVLLYFLLGQDMQSTSAHRFSFWTLITYRFGDLPLLLAAVLLYQAYDTWSLQTIFELVNDSSDTHQVMGMPLLEVVGGLIALSAFARSAQFLLHTWLPYTMEGPTPVSALMHAGIVNAGGFLINRFAPVYVYTDDVLHWVFLVGLVTALVGSVLMLSQNDIKKSLGYSTMGQMGFMIMECGLGAFSLAIFHLIAHGLFKGTMFMNAGSIIGEARQHDAVPKDKLYTFIIEKQDHGRRYPWQILAILTLLVPIGILGVAHWAVEPEIFKQQGAVVLLFFGWITGVQLLLSTNNMRSQKPWRLISLIVFSFTVVVIGYTLISHAFAQFLYPEPGFIHKLYAAAHIDLSWSGELLAMVAVVIGFGWVSAYFTDKKVALEESITTRMWMSFYALISREFYIAELFSVLTRWLLLASARLNSLLRWG